MDKPFAAFDIDGTVIRWQLYHAIGDAMAKRGIIQQSDFSAVRDARMNWKRRSDAEGFSAYESALVAAFDHAISGLDEKVFHEISEEVFMEYRDQVYTFTRDLISRLKSKNYLLFAVSGSPAAVVKLFADYYGFTDFAATDYPSENGRLLGTKNIAVGRKPELLKTLVQKHKANSAGSIAVGDSEGDIGMLEMVERPIAMNPSQQLFDHAQIQGWEIIVERKNVVYRLKKHDGSYILASANA